MKLLVQALSLSALVLFTSCAHHRGCGDKSQCDMKKEKCSCSQCDMKKDAPKEEAKK